MTDVLDLLAAANPVPQAPAVEPPERLRQAIEADGLPYPSARHRQAPGRLLTALALAVAAAAAVAVGLTVSGGSPSRDLDVVAAAYAAVSTEGGVLEAQFSERMPIPGHRPIVERYREWVDTSTGMRRELRTLRMRPPRGGREVSVTTEVATSPGWLEYWTDTPWEKRRGTIQRREYPDLPNAGRRSGARSPTAASPPAQEGIEAYRRLYQTGSIRLVGHERLHGRLLWKLESVTPLSVGVTNRHGFEQAYVVVVLVDPSTFLPVLQRSFNLLAPGHREREGESELLEYRRLPASPASEALLKLSSQHPHARVITHRWRGPRP